MPTVSIWIALRGLIFPKNGRSKWRICRSDLVPARAVPRHIGDHQSSFLTSRLTRCGCAGTSQFSAETRTTSLMVESGTLFRRKSPWNFLYVLSRKAESELAGPRTDRLGDGPCADRD